jgi:hypothetical protein
MSIVPIFLIRTFDALHQLRRQRAQLLHPPDANSNSKSLKNLPSGKKALCRLCENALKASPTNASTCSGRLFLCERQTKKGLSAH